MPKGIPSTFGQFRNLSFRRLGGPNRDIGDDFAGGKGRPKLKFNFTVHIHFRMAAGLDLSSERAVFCDVGLSRSDAEGVEFQDGGGDDVNAPPNNERGDMKEMVFPIKQASRPNPTVTMQDVNYYNFRTKVGTKVDYGTMQLTFYDDVNNTAHYFFEKYLKLLSPIANIRNQSAKRLDLDGNGLRNNKFNAGPIQDGARVQGGSGSIGPLMPDDENGEGRMGLIESISVRHYYITQGLGDVTFVDYVFVNPKVVNMTLDELDMTQSDVTTVNLNFAYDYVYIDSPDFSDDLVPAAPSDTDATFEQVYPQAVAVEQAARDAERARQNAIQFAVDGAAGPEPPSRRELIRQRAQEIADRRDETISDIQAQAARENDPRYGVFDFNRVRARQIAIQREIARIRRLDTIPDISVLEVADSLIPPITGNLPPILEQTGSFLDTAQATAGDLGDILTGLPGIPDVPDINLDL